MMVSLTLSPSKSIHSYNPIPGGCVLYLPLWNPACHGPVFKSIDPFGHVCTRTGGVPGSNGITMDGDDVISIPSHPKLITGTRDHTILAWFNVPYASNTIFGMGQGAVGASAWQDGYWWAASTLGNYYVEASPFVGNIAVGYSENTWQFGAVSFDYNSLISAYINDGAAVTAAYTSAVPIDATVNVGIGANHYDSTTVWKYFLTGTIREVWAYDRLLSVGEIAYIYNQTKWFL